MTGEATDDGCQLVLGEAPPPLLQLQPSTALDPSGSCSSVASPPLTPQYSGDPAAPEDHHQRRSCGSTDFRGLSSSAPPSPLLSLSGSPLAPQSSTAGSSTCGLDSSSSRNTADAGRAAQPAVLTSGGSDCIAPVRQLSFSSPECCAEEELKGDAAGGGGGDEVDADGGGVCDTLSLQQEHPQQQQQQLQEMTPEELHEVDQAFNHVFVPPWAVPPPPPPAWPPLPPPPTAPPPRQQQQQAVTAARRTFREAGMQTGGDEAPHSTPQQACAAASPSLDVEGHFQVGAPLLHSQHHLPP